MDALAGMRDKHRGMNPERFEIERRVSNAFTAV
jgi:hypothetical protein